MEISYASSSAKDFAAGGGGSGGSGRQVKVIPLRHPVPSSASSSVVSSFVPLLAFLLPPRWRTKFKQMTLLEWVELFIPCTRWIRTYKWREYLQVDLMAGLTVGIMLVPQAMSYAKLAGLQPIYGLFFVAPLCDGIHHSHNSPSDEALGENQEKAAVSKGSWPTYWSYFWYSFCEIVSSVINFCAYMQVGAIPQGLPKFSVPKEFGYVKSLIPTAFLITGVAILESVGIAKALAAKNGYELDSNQEDLETGKKIGIGSVTDGLYRLLVQVATALISASSRQIAGMDGRSSIMRWHERLGHLLFQLLKKLFPRLFISVSTFYGLLHV